MGSRARAGGPLVAVVIVLLAASALGQTTPATPIPPQHPVESRGSDAPERSGFTVELSLGFGMQFVKPDAFESSTELGLSGLNLGLGGFLNPTIALLFKFAGTVTFPEAQGVDFSQVAGVAGPVVQLWPLEVLKLEAGLGFGVISREASATLNGVTLTVSDDEVGFGLMAGLGWAFWQNRKHSLQLITYWAPVFAEDTTIHTLSFAFGWQLL